MLADGQPLIEIAMAVGYETAWNFTVMFKRVTGVLPSRYHPQEKVRATRKR